jgi:hypothetical protein
MLVILVARAHQKYNRALSFTLSTHKYKIISVCLESLYSTFDTIYRASITSIKIHIWYHKGVFGWAVAFAKNAVSYGL